MLYVPKALGGLLIARLMLRWFLLVGGLALRKGGGLQFALLGGTVFAEHDLGSRQEVNQPNDSVAAHALVQALTILGRVVVETPPTELDSALHLDIHPAIKLAPAVDTVLGNSVFDG